MRGLASANRRGNRKVAARIKLPCIVNKPHTSGNNWTDSTCDVASPTLPSTITAEEPASMGHHIKPHNRSEVYCNPLKPSTAKFNTRTTRSSHLLRPRFATNNAFVPQAVKSHVFQRVVDATALQQIPQAVVTPTYRPELVVHDHLPWATSAGTKMRIEIE